VPPSRGGEPGDVVNDRRTPPALPRRLRGAFVVASITASRYPGASRPVHALVLGGTIALFLGAVLADVVYAATYHIQWSDFASWLIVGALAFCAVALVLAVLALVRSSRGPRDAAYAVVVAVTWIAGLFSALMHARDAWAIMPGGLVLSVIATVLACVSAWLGLARAGLRK
jgi:uncharacterized membrane protein